MENKELTFIKTDDREIINKRCIRWVKKIEDCFEICIKSTGCVGKFDTHTVCKSNNPKSYDELNKYFEKDVN